MDVGDDPYQVLGVDPKAEYSAIKKAYRKLALKQHPDKGGDPVQFAKIANAYEIVSDPKQRHNYDLQQQNGTNKGYDPKGPEFTNTSEDYDPNQQPAAPTSSSMPSMSTSTSRQPGNNKTSFTTTTSYEPEEWTTTYTTSSSDGGKPQTTYTTSSSSSSSPFNPGKTTKTRTTTTTSGNFHFQDPMELFRRQFPEAAQHHSMSSPTKSSSSKPKKSKMTSNSSTIPITEPMSQMSVNNSTNGDTSIGGGEKEVMGMASSTRTVNHPNGQQELITETVITYFDGSTETKRESKMVGGKSNSQSIPQRMGSSSPSTVTRMNKPSSKKSSKNKTISSPKKTTKMKTTRSSTTTNSDDMIPVTTTKTVLKNGVPVTMTATTMMPSNSIPQTTTKTKTNTSKPTSTKTSGTTTYYSY